MRLLPSIPAILSFTSDKYSGSQPYVLSVVIASKNAIDGVKYDLEVVTGMASGSCPGDAGVTFPQPLIAESFMITNTAVYVNNVNAGVCRRFITRIRDIESGEIISSGSLAISNL